MDHAMRLMANDLCGQLGVDDLSLADCLVDWKGNSEWSRFESFGQCHISSFELV